VYTSTIRNSHAKQTHPHLHESQSFIIIFVCFVSLAQKKVANAEERRRMWGGWVNGKS